MLCTVSRALQRTADSRVFISFPPGALLYRVSRRVVDFFFARVNGAADIRITYTTTVVYRAKPTAVRDRNTGDGR